MRSNMASSSTVGMATQSPESRAALLRAVLGARPDARLFRAEFQYLPLRDSPNDNPHVELALHPGELLLVHGPMDEDKFYWGETLDGRAGLVPSNFVQRVQEDELREMLATTTNALPQYHPPPSFSHHCPAIPSTSSAVNFPPPSSILAQPSTSTALMTRPESPSFSLAVPQHLAQISHDFTDSQQFGAQKASSSTLPDSVCPYPPVDVSRITVQEIKQPDQPRVPWPRELQVERRLSRSVLLSWLPPENVGSAFHQQPISQYQIECQPFHLFDEPPSIAYHCDELSLAENQEIDWKTIFGATLALILCCLLFLAAIVKCRKRPKAPKRRQRAIEWVCVNGQVRAVVPGTFKCRALLEDLDLDKSVNISVRAVGPDGVASPDAACTLAVGIEAPVAPQHVRVGQITPTSVQLSWLPSNSSAEHIVLLNALKVGICPPTVFQVQLDGLTPSTIYRLSVRTKHPRAVLEKRPVERCVDFKTLPKIGLPDPPMDVQAESGPQPGTLLVSWRPNSSQPRPPSRAAVHGYLIYADGRCIAQVPGSTADHVLLRLADFADDPPVFLSVRTRTREGTMSADSNVVRVPRNGGGGGGGIGGFGSKEDQILLSSSLPSHLLGRLITNNGHSPPSNKILAANQPAVQNQQQQGLLLMPAIPISSTSNQQQPMGQILQNGPTINSNNINSSSRWGPESAIGVTGRQQQHYSTATLSSQHSFPQQSQQQSTQQQYFTFHPKALDKEFPRLDERPDVLAMEQNYLLRHQQRQQRFRSATPVDRRSFPMGAPSKGRPQATMATILPGGTFFPQNISHGGGGARLPIIPQLARLQQEPGSTRSEPDLRPTRVPGMEESRWFVAIQDHQPPTRGGGMGQSEELAFRRHQLVKVYGDVDGNGCFSAEVRGRYGLVPAGKLVEIAKDDLFMAAEQRRQMMMTQAPPPLSMATTTGAGPSTSSSNLRRMRWGSIKSRSYEHTESGQHRRQRAFMGGSDHEGVGGAIEPGENSTFWGRGYATAGGGGGGMHGSGMGRIERRMSANVEGGGGMGGGTGYRLPTINGAKMPWREEESYQTHHQPQMEPPTRNEPRNVMDEYGLGGEMDVDEMGEGGPDMTMSMSAPHQLMVAKYDYDSRHLSPNVDAEQVELSFRQGDMITVYGPMDDDGFYLGELKGVRGLVPSNFLQPADSYHQQQPQPPPPDTMPTTRQKGVAFSSDLGMANHVGGGVPSAPPWSASQQNSTTSMPSAKPAATGRRLGATSTGAGGGGGPAATTARLTGGTGMNSKSFKIAAMATTAASGKFLAKKSSDLSARTLQQQQQQPASRKTSQAQGGKGGTAAAGSALKKKG